jgi:WD40 repeat protein
MEQKRRLFTFSVLAVVLLALSCGCKPSLTGKLLLQRVGTDSEGQSISLGLFELQGGWREPRELTDPGFDQSAITGTIIAVSPDQRYIVFRPHFMLDTENGTTAPIPDTVGTSLVYQIGAAAFSPDGRYLAYIADRVLSVMELTSNTARQIYQSKCTEYIYGGFQCSYLGDPSWIDSNTLVFAHRKGLPFTFVQGSEEDPNTPNHITVMTYQGDVILSAESPAYRDYRAIGNVVLRYYNKEWVDAWLDGTDLGNGVYQPHNLCGSTDSCSRLGSLETASRDGRYILSSDDSQWRIIEVRTGHETDLGTRHQPSCSYFTKCLWSPDETQLACLDWDACNVRQTLYLIPLSKESGRILYTEEHHNWEIFDWRP